jgi:hypothetical protein
MSKLTSQQQTELQTYIGQGKPQNFEFVELKDCFLQRCFAELINSEEVRNKLNHFFAVLKRKEDYLKYKKIETEASTKYGFNDYQEVGGKLQAHFCFFDQLGYLKKMLVIQTLLSRTPDGKAVIPFLDVETLEHKKAKSADMPDYVLKKIRPQTLQEKMSLEFWKALSMQGNNIEEAMAIINRTFIDETLV